MTTLSRPGDLLIAYAQADSARFEVGVRLVKGPTTRETQCGQWGRIGRSVPFYVACTHRPSGEVWCLGNRLGIPGAPGDGPLPLAANWHRVLGVSTSAQLSIGTTTTCARGPSNALICWGAADDTDIAAGDLGVPRTYPTYVPTP